MNALVERIGWTLVHSLWEGGLIWAGLQVAMAALRWRSAQARYLTCGVALVLAALAPWATFLRIDVSAKLQPVWSGTIAAAKAPIIPPPAIIFPGDAAGWRACLDTGMEVVLPWLVLLWGLGCMWGTLKLSADWIATRQLSARGQEPLPEAIAERCRLLAQRLGIRRVIQLGASILVDIPCVVGWLKPAILFPVGGCSGLSSVQIDALLAHELAHIVRNDFVVNVLQSVCGVVFFYHPAIIAINDSIRRERENACDDIAVALTGDSVGYAAALTRLEEARQPKIVLAASGGGNLLGRIRRLLGRPAAARPLATAAWGALLCVGLYLAMFVFAPGILVRAVAGESPHGPTGFYRAEEFPADDLRMMLFVDTHGPEPRTEVLYVASLPDLTLRDVHNAVLRDGEGLRLDLTPDARSRLKVFTHKRTAGGRIAREAIVVDGVVVAAPVFRHAIDAAGFTIAGNMNQDHLTDWTWTDRFIREVAAQNDKN